MRKKFKQPIKWAPFQGSKIAVLLYPALVMRNIWICSIQQYDI